MTATDRNALVSGTGQGALGARQCAGSKKFPAGWSGLVAGTSASGELFAIGPQKCASKTPPNDAPTVTRGCREKENSATNSSCAEAANFHATIAFRFTLRLKICSLYFIDDR